MSIRTLTLACSLLQPASLALAQLRPGDAAPPLAAVRWLAGEQAGDAVGATLVAFYTGSGAAARRRFADDADCLADLHRRFGAGLRVVVVQHSDEVAAPPAWRGLAIAQASDGAATAAWLGDEDPLWYVFVVGGRGEIVFAGQPAAGLVDAIERTLAGRPAVATERQVAALRADALVAFDDQTGHEFAAAAQDALRHAPRDGLLRGLHYLALTNKANDWPAAQQALAEATKVLAAEPRPLAAFADIALRGDGQRAELVAALQPMLVAAARAAPADPVVQLACLRALVLAGEHRQVGRQAMLIRKLVTATVDGCLEFAAILTTDADAAVHRDLATIALNAAAALGAPDRLLTAARYGVALRCGGDAEGAKALLDGYLHGIEQRVSLNNDCWYLMTDLPTMGRFDWFAGGLAERMLEQRDALDYFEFDTVALAMFLTGKVAAAVELQELAIERGGEGNRAYHERLARYRAAAAPAPR